MDVLKVSGGTPPALSPLPFRLSSPPQHAYEHPSWQQAERALLEAIAAGRSMLLLGEAGTGKTLLLRRLAQTLHERGTGVREIGRDDDLDLIAKQDVLLIDEAGLFTAAALERICRLPNPFVMAGLPNLPELLPQGLGSVTLAPLGAEAVARFVRARLEACGRRPDLFTPEAVAALARQSGGLLRLVIILAGAASFFAEQRGGAVTASDIDDAASMRTAAADDVASPEPALAEQTAPSRAVVTMRARPWAEPVWPRSSALRRTRGRGRIIGLAGWVCASLALVGVASFAARALDPAPVVAKAAIPDLPVARTVATAGSAPVAVAASLPPAPALRLPPPPPLRAPAPALVPAASVLSSAALQRSLPPAPLRLPAAEPSAEQAEREIAFSGPIMNDTMGQGGQLSLKLRTVSALGGPVGAVFHASHGLIGTGVLNGEIGPHGRVTLSGRLMMGNNPFDCALEATLQGDRLVGEAVFIRNTNGAIAHSRFSLSKF